MNILGHSSVRFIIVGAIATMTHAVMAMILLSFDRDLSVLKVNTAAFLIAVLVSYAGHALYTFKMSGSLYKYILTSIICLFINNTVAFVFDHIAKSKPVAIAVGMLVAPIVGYAISRKWVFSDRQNTKS